VLAALSRIEANTQFLNSNSQSIAMLESHVEQLVNALNQIEEDELWSQSETNPKRTLHD
jgi:glycerol-3-phosphate responsive antiterminator